MSNFEASLQSLVAAELSRKDRSSETLAAAFERQLNSIALTAAVMSGGNNDALDKLLTGADQYLAEASTRLIPLAQMMRGSK